MNISKLLRDLAPKLPAEASRKLRHIAESPAVSELIAESEAALIKERKALRAQLGESPAKFKAEQEKCAAAVVAADKRLDAARIELEAAVGAQARARGAALSISHSAEMHTASLVRQLEETADVRLSQLIGHCQHVIAEIQTVANRKYPQTAEVYAVYTAARTVLAGIVEQCGQLRLEPLTTAEVTMRLRGFIVQMRGAVQPIGETHLASLIESFEQVIA